ncbi:MAG: hypothetical protein NC095_11645 [Muribaculum sp.]|nr:hypothetical protein [Muribaculum sp.]
MDNFEIKILVVLALTLLLNTTEVSGQSSDHNDNVNADILSNVLDNEINEPEYKPILEIGKTWRYRRYYRSSPEMEYTPDPYYDMRVEYKTTDNGRDVYMMSVKFYGEEEFKPDMLAYEENGVLYYLTDEYCDYVPMVDFSARVGDIIPDCEYEVLKKEYINIEGIDRCVTTLKGPYSDKQFFWVEGIGAVSNRSITPMPEAISVGTKMSECSMNGECLFKESDLDILLSAPILKEEKENDIFYDLSGRQVRNPQKGSIYINSYKNKILK